MDDHADVPADSHRPKVRVLRPVELVEAHTRIGRIELEIEGRGFDRLLLLTGQLGQVVGEGVGDAEFHLLCLFGIADSIGPIGVNSLQLFHPALKEIGGVSSQALR